MGFTEIAIYKQIAMELENSGYIKTWKQGQMKITDAIDKSHNNISGNAGTTFVKWMIS